MAMSNRVGLTEPWRIAKGYDTLEEAIKGHARFSSMTKEELMEYKYID